MKKATNFKISAIWIFSCILLLIPLMIILFQLFFKKNTPLLLTHFENRPYVILTCFAGRRQYLEILLKYTEYLHNSGDIDEVHLWDFTRDENDTEWLRTSPLVTSASYISVKHVNDKSSWSEYYNHYTQEAYPDHVIIKCDDDIVFIDVKAFPEFIKRTVQDDNHLVRFASIVNNDVCADSQQKWGLIPKSFGEFPHVSLWHDAALTQKLHEYFLDNTMSWLETSHNLQHATVTIPLGKRISINFFAVCSKNLYIYQMLGGDDEYDLTITITENLQKPHAIDGNFTVAHYAFYTQRSSMNEPLLLQRYTELANNLS
jgi:hypothetical protein